MDQGDDDTTITHVDEPHYDTESNSRITLPPSAPLPNVDDRKSTEPAQSWESVISETLARTFKEVEEMRSDFFNWVDANSKKQNANWRQLANDIQEIKKRLQEGDERFARIEQMFSDHDELDRKMIDRISTLTLKPHALTGNLPLQGITVLILEDDAHLRLAMTDVCREAGASVHSTSSVEEANQSLTDPGVNVATIDILLGASDGLPFIREMRAHHREVAILIVTGRIPQEQAVEVTALHCSVLQKPFTPDELVGAILRAHQKK